MADDRDASISDAAFREALDAYDKARDYLRGLKPNGLVGHQLWAERQVEESRARVLALYAERQGVECVVAATGRETIDGALTTIRVAPVEGSALPVVQLGDRVLVSKVEAV